MSEGAYWENGLPSGVQGLSSQFASFPGCVAGCRKVAELEDRIEELEEENRELREEVAAKDEKIKYLWKKLRKYRNPHSVEQEVRALKAEFFGF